MNKPYGIFFLVILLFTQHFCAQHLAAQDFSRVIEMQRQRMNGADVAKLQRQLLFLGFKKTGAADGWYGPLTEGSIKTVQHYMGFAQDGKVTRNVWNMLFDPRQEGILRNIGILSASNGNAMITTLKRDGTNADFDEWTVAAVKDDVKTVLFRYVHEGLIIFRFKLYYLADAVFMIQDVYYGDYQKHVYLKTAAGFFELKNGERINADAAMEGILTRAREGIAGAGLKPPPPLVPDFSAANIPGDTVLPAASGTAGTSSGKTAPVSPGSAAVPAGAGTAVPVPAEQNKTDEDGTSMTPVSPAPVMTPEPKNPTPISPQGIP